MGKIREGEVLAARELPTVGTAPVRVPDPERLVHLQFRRYVDCPICNLHLREFAARHGELTAAGVREVVAFHSERAQLLAYGADLPMDLVPDPRRELYREFGVERSWLALADPITWLAAVRGVVAPDGPVIAVRYGRHASDQWPVGTVLRLAERATAT